MTSAPQKARCSHPPASCHISMSSLGGLEASRYTQAKSEFTAATERRWLAPVNQCSPRPPPALPERCASLPERGAGSEALHSQEPPFVSAVAPWGSESENHVNSAVPGAN